MAVKASSSITLTRVNDGNDGATGIGISKTEVYYYLSTSNTTQTGGAWVTTPPTWVNDKYYWQKIKSTFTDGTTSESTPVCITGSRGATGKSVSSITTEFYLSTSKTTQSGGSWTTSMPTWSQGNFLWTRSKIIYANPSSTVYTTPICDSSWEAVNNVEIGGRNLYIIKHASEGYLLVNGTSLEVMNTIRREHTSEFIPVQSGDEYVFQTWVTIDPSDTSDPNLWMAYDFFDDEQTAIGTRPALRVNTTLPNGKAYGMYHITIPSGTAYLRVTARFYSDGQVKLEKGNKATDWTPAPEDMASADLVESTRNDLSNSIVGVSTELDNISNDIADSKDTIDNAILIIEENKEQIASLIQDAASITMNFETLTTTVMQINDELITEVDERVKYIRFIDGEIWLGKEAEENEDDFKVSISNQRMSFWQNDTEVAYLSNNKLYITDAQITSTFRIGNFEFSVRSNGNLGINWIDE